MNSRRVRHHVVAISGPGIVGEQISVRKIDAVLQKLAYWTAGDSSRDFSRFSGKVPVKWSRGGIIFPRIPVTSKEMKRIEFFEPLRAAAGLDENANDVVTVFHLQDGVLHGVEKITAKRVNAVKLKTI